MELSHHDTFFGVFISLLIKKILSGDPDFIDADFLGGISTPFFKSTPSTNANIFSYYYAHFGKALMVPLLQHQPVELRTVVRTVVRIVVHSVLLPLYQSYF